MELRDLVVLLHTNFAVLFEGRVFRKGFRRFTPVFSPLGLVVGLEVRMLFRIGAPECSFTFTLGPF